MWLAVISTWIATFWWTRLILSGVVLVLALLVLRLGGWEGQKKAGGTVSAAVLFSLCSHLAPPRARPHIVGFVLACIVSPLLAFLLARAVDRGLARRSWNAYFGAERGLWVLGIPILVWATTLIGGWHGQWVLAYPFAVAGLTAGIRWVWPGSDGNQWRLPPVIGLVLTASLAMAIGPVLWPLPFGIWYWGTSLLLLVLPSVAVFLAELAWYRTHPLHHWDEKFRSAAVQKLRSQRMLAKVAVLDDDWSVQKLAFARITEKEALLFVAKGGSSRSSEALPRLSDPALIADVAEFAVRSEVRREATKRTTDQNVLVRIAKHDTDSGVREQAAMCVVGPSSLADLALSADDTNVRRRALERLDDQAILIGVATKDPDHGLRRVAVERVEDVSLLSRIAREDRNEGVRLAAVARVVNPALLAEIVRTDQSPAVRRKAVQHLEDPTLLAQLASTHPDPKIREEAISRVNDPSLLADCAKTDRDGSVRLAAIQRVTDQRVLAQAAEADPGLDVAEAAVDRLQDEAVLERLASGSARLKDRAAEKWMKLQAERHSADDPALRRSAADKLWRALTRIPQAKTAPFPLLAKFALADLPDDLFDALERGPRERRKIALKALIALGATSAAVETRMGSVGPRARQALAEMESAKPQIPKVLLQRERSRRHVGWQWSVPAAEPPDSEASRGDHGGPSPRAGGGPGAFRFGGRG